MTLAAISLMTLGALGVWLFRKGRPTALLALSVVAIFALQTEQTEQAHVLAGLAVGLPLTTILLVIGVWWLVTPTRAPGDWSTLALIGMASAVGSTLPALSALNTADLRAAAEAFAGDALAAIPLVALITLGVAGAGVALPGYDEAARRRLALMFITLIIALLAVVKVPVLQAAAAQLLAQATAPVVLNWGWIGFSYVAFRLMHVLLDYRIGRLGVMSLRDFALYVLFFPAIPAGPIARIEHFAKQLAAETRLDSGRLLDAATRIGRGLFKKFIVADTLAFLALSPQMAAQTNTGTLGGALALWAMLYAYAFRLFFDFSGYTDIAIGIGKLAGITLPENFDSPYTKRNITAFWNSWHITLSTWFRLYFFTPLTRALMGTALKGRRWLIMLIAQVGTMALIGLWHGALLNFVLWGAWHGVGLWAHKWLTEQTRGWDEFVGARPALARLIGVGSVLTTFHFVALGWVFFALPDLALIGRTLAGLAGR